MALNAKTGDTLGQAFGSADPQESPIPCELDVRQYFVIGSSGVFYARLPEALMKNFAAPGDNE